MIIGYSVNTTNPSYTSDDFLFWEPQFTNYFKNNEEAAKKAFDKFYSICNNKIFKSTFGSDWEMAMSLAIAHYFTLWAKNSVVPSGSDLATIAGGGNYQGIITSASVGEFSKTFDTQASLDTEDAAAKWWNQTAYGASYWNLWVTKSRYQVPLFVVVNPSDLTTKK